MRLTMAILGFLFLATTLMASDAPEVNQAEVLRLGNFVQHVEGNTHRASEDLFVQAMGPPESDADKWFVSVLSMKACSGCIQLKKEWSTNPWLLALADPANPKRSWAHYNVYDGADESQTFRFQNLRVQAYPTVIVQPPRNGKYGVSTTVVFQDVYRGDPKQLATDITSAIRRYVSKLAAKNVAPVSQKSYGQHGIDPPWIPTPNDPYRPDEDRSPFPTLPIPPVEIEPKVEANFDIPWATIAGLIVAGFSVPAIIALSIKLLQMIRERRKADGKPLIVEDDGKFEQILSALKDLGKSQTTKRTTTRRRTR